ncbi:serine hydrolase domain-containing protein [Larkinella insperata]|uniref:Serine hydrolase domain-containing protein n=1 Tax=Larkinella insperata TaxID=332158 RepID=A0ABW3QAE4_9BACT|nr:serine hydrolase domain-containing protein [Larkinella insperata]
MKKIILPIVLLLSVFACRELEVPQPSAVSTVDYSQHPKNAEYLAYVKDYQQKSQSPGAVMLVAKGNDPLWAGAVGFSNLEHRTPFGTETPFRIGSITKVFVSALVLKLVEEDRLRLDDKLATLLPQLAGAIPSSDQITVRQLLAHTSGVIDPPNQSLRYQTDIVNDPGALKSLTTQERLQKYVTNQALLFQPGSNYSYSNPGYWLLELIIENVSGQSLSAQMAEKLLIPLGLTRTHLDRGTDNNVARGYTVTTPGNVRDVTTWDVAEGNGMAAGGLVSTVGDIHRFYTALFGGKIISASLLADMQKQQLANCTGPDCEYGLGLEIWHVGGKTGFGHNGALIGIEANALYFPETKTTVVLYKNLGGGSDKSFLEKIAQ